LDALSEKINREVAERESDLINISGIAQRSSPTPASWRSGTPGSSSIVDLGDDEASTDAELLDAPGLSKRRRV
jgi:hypothetical protein